jgi:SNF2 family DNA or RNA helicase
MKIDGSSAFNMSDIKTEPLSSDCPAEPDQEWTDAPKELLRRATRTFVQEEELHETDQLGQWCANGRAVELTSFKGSGPSGQFILQGDLYQRLRPYQREGVAWMAQLYHLKQGLILADEMGLGKTVQALALLSGAKKAGAKHALIIVPVTLLDQWDREASKWCSEWRIYTYHGSPAQRVRALQGVMTPEGGILLTSYAVLKNADERLLQVVIPELDASLEMTEVELCPPKKRQRGSAPQAEAKIQKKAWDLVICDEAHVMRNISTLLGRHLRSIVSNSRVLLTGTPVQNALQDLWSLMDFAQPGLLGNHATFVKNVSDPINKGSVRGASPCAVQLKKHLCEELWELVKPHLLRRTKESVGLLGATEASGPTERGLLGRTVLPPKSETVIWLMPTSEQIKATQKLLEKSDVIQEANSHGKMGLAVFRAIALLKKLCNHPALGLPVSQPGAWQEFLSEALGKSRGKRKACKALTDAAAVQEEAVVEDGEADDARAGRAVEMMLRRLPRDVESLTLQSAKLRCLAKLLPALASKGHRTLIFSQGLKMMDLVELCVLKRLGISYLRIDGSTDVQSRADRVQQFQTQTDSFQCMLLTTSVGGYGLNLTSADRVVLLDPAWNPALDAQAVERVYRIGQKREVKIYRLVMSGLIEDKMFRLQVFKMGLTKTALEAKQQQRYFTSAEIRGLFEWTDPSQGETRNLLLEKHGEDQEKTAQINAQQDGANEGWFEAGPAIGLSNFSNLYNCLAHGDCEADDECDAQVAEMKAKLGQVDENMHRTEQQRQAVEEELKAAHAAVQAASKSIAESCASRAKALALTKSRQADLNKARRHEAAATQHLEKVMRRRSAAREAKMNAEQTCMQAEHDLLTLGRSVAEAVSTWRDASTAVELALQGANEKVCLVQLDGTATAGGQVQVTAGKAKTAQRLMERVHKAWDQVKSAWLELESAEDTWLKLESSSHACQRDRSKAESAQAKAVQRVEALRDSMAATIAALVEAGTAFADALQCNQDRPLSAAALKALQQAAKSGFRQASTSWTRARQLQEAWVKASALRRRAAKKVSVSATSHAEAEAWLETVDGEHQDSLAAEERESSSRLACEQALLEAEALQSAAEVETAGQKCRRSECQANIAAARSKLKPAKVAEKQASAGRVALLNHYTKVDKGQIKMELQATESSAKEARSALSALKAEEYDANQVEEAYNQARKKLRADGE